MMGLSFCDSGFFFFSCKESLPSTQSLYMCAHLHTITVHLYPVRRIKVDDFKKFVKDHKTANSSLLSP